MPATAAPTAEQHAIYHPLLRGAAAAFGFFDLMLADPKSGRIIYSVDKEVDFATSLRTGPYRASNVSAAVARCAATADRSAVCFEDFAPYAPSRGAPTAFMAAPVIDQGVVIAVLIAQLSIEEIDNVVTGDRQLATGRLRRHRRGLPRWVRPLRALRPAGFLRKSRPVLRRAEGGGESDENIDAIRRYGTPVLHQRVVDRGERGPLWPASKAPARSSAIAASRRSRPGGRLRFPAPSGR